MIDIHTHTFPDTIAQKTIEALSAKSRSKAFLNGTLAALAEDGKKNGIALSVVLPVVTNPLKTEKINLSSALINEQTEETGVFSFGGVHPDTPNVKEEIRAIKRLGLKGIKIHPAYQQVRLNDIRYQRIVGYAEEEGLIVLAHGGIDIGIDGDWSSPAMCREILDTVHPTKFIMAHMGGWQQWHEVADLLAGRDVYLDTAFSYGDIAYLDPSSDGKRQNMDKETFLSLIRAHGADKILFGTDSPWTDRKQQIDRIEALPLSSDEKDAIFFENAKKLLSL